MLGNIRWPELLLLLLVILLVFGVGRISKIAGELGHGIRAFKDGLSGDEKAKTSKDSEPSDKTDE